MADEPGTDAVFALIADNRRQIADMFAGLDERQWEQTSLCTSWTVRQLAGHLILPFSVSLPRMIAGVIANRGSFDRFSVKASSKLAEQPTAQIIKVLRGNAESRFTPPGLGPAAPLTDTSIHLRDAARPLGLDVSPPLSTWRLVLDFLVSPPAKRAFVPATRLTGLTFRATDQDWSSGTGAEIAGPREALAMAMAGRVPALADLTGPGVDTLRARLG